MCPVAAFDFSQLNLNDPFIQRVALAAGGIIILAIILRALGRRRENAAWARRRAELRQTYGQMQLEQEEIERLAGQIIATSSTRTIAGFSVVRQIEAVFTDGHPTPTKAVETLKALAAQKGANAIINLSNERVPSGKCVAHGDAVIVKTVGRPPSAPPA